MTRITVNKYFIIGRVNALRIERQFPELHRLTDKSLTAVQSEIDYLRKLYLWLTGYVLI